MRNRGNHGFSSRGGSGVCQKGQQNKRGGGCRNRGRRNKNFEGALPNQQLFISPFINQNEIQSTQTQKWERNTDRSVGQREFTPKVNIFHDENAQRSPESPVSMHAVVKQEQCILCYACETSCPTGAITIEDKVIIDPEKCVGCGGCASVCPQEAIVLEPAGY